MIRIESSGAILQVFLVDALDLSRACVVSPIRPVPARICLGEYVGGPGGYYHQCRLDIKWPEKLQSYGPPVRFVRKNRGQQNDTGRMIK